MANHSATKLDAIFAEYEKIAEGHHHNLTVRKEIIEELGAKSTITIVDRKDSNLP